MTTALDRLERAGYARRVRDACRPPACAGRVDPEAWRRWPRFYSEHAAYAERLYQRYTAEQLELLLRFVRESREFNERRAGHVERQTRERENLHKPV